MSAPGEPLRGGYSPEVAAVLRRRAERLRGERTEDEEQQSLLWIAEFAMADEVYAIPLAALRAAIPLRLVTPVPLAAPHVLGIVRFEGQIIAAQSLASLLGGRPWAADPTTLLVLDRGGGRLTALDCEQIPKPTSLPLRAVEEARARAPSQPVFQATTPDLRLVNLIDVARLLESRAREAAGGP